MKTPVKAVPDGYTPVTPYLCADGAAEAIAFYKRAFDAREVLRVPGPDGRIGHAEVEIAGARVMLADEHPDINFRSPRALGGSPVHIHLYVDDADRFADQAVAAGGKLLRPVTDQFYGDRTGTVEDPFGHVWHLATHKEEVPLDELERRMDRIRRMDRAASAA